jgi:hypothetical protein
MLARDRHVASRGAATLKKLARRAVDKLQKTELATSSPRLIKKLGAKAKT